jgi:hypothetical protein
VPHGIVVAKCEVGVRARYDVGVVAAALHQRVGALLALLNLCRNSAYAVPDGGTITVAARKVDSSPGAS